MKLTNNFKVIKTNQLSRKWADEITELSVRTFKKPGTYLYWDISHLNADDMFCVVGLLDDKVIARCNVWKSNDYNNHFYIEKLIVDSDYQKMGYGTRLIDSTITIIKDLNASKIGVYCENRYSEKIFESLDFIRHPEIKSYMGITDDEAVFYELNLIPDIYLVDINEEDTFSKQDVLFTGILLEKEFKKQKIELPNVLSPHRHMYKNDIYASNKMQNEVCKILKSGKRIIGYIDMFYEDYETIFESDHSIYPYLFVNREYLSMDTIKVVIDEIEAWYKEKVKENKIDKILIYQDWLLKADLDRYHKCLTELGYELIDGYYTKKHQNIIK